ncbi:hypothetical protein ATO12_19270 [Aquimarina atlantica]|uniref:Uncharacterized protein n=1 Tax=Aquimarina atlantica TaxID=1317122 RepID=A0A023BT89_9FLAO|nr:hypothetical protein [Aquimarina atlantica]EZH73149.1 hypothetical protein ATO12_19270 [Aquimarina atlantica]
MFKKILKVEGVQKLNKDKQKSVKGGHPTLIRCTYSCSGTTARLNNGNYLNCAAIIYDAIQCGGDGNGGGVWA